MSLWDHEKSEPEAVPVASEASLTKVRIAAWMNHGKVGLVIMNAPIVEFEGQLAPGIGLPPLDAIELAEIMLQKARQALAQEDENEDGE